MSEEAILRQDEKVLAGLAHGSILLGIFTNGIGGIVAALVIWLLQKEKSAYAAAQALQALVYQAATFVVTMLAWCCWGMLWMLMLLPPIFANPAAYENAPPPGLWLGLILMAIPIGLWGLTILYGLWAAARCLSGHDFKYALIGNWLESQQ
ncbi:MAG: DUF4870 domain-containing protein [Anaerolineae bacterium]|jgi:uncharacterized Tic20 family protein